MEIAGEIHKDGHILFFTKINLKGKIEQQDRKCIIMYVVSRKEKDCRKYKVKEDSTERSCTVASFVLIFLRRHLISVC